MAVAFDSSTTYNLTVAGTTKTQSFTNTAGTFIVVSFALKDSGTAPTGVTVSYSSAPLTVHVNAVQQQTSYWLYTFYLGSGVATGVNDVIISWTNNCLLAGGAWTCTGAGTTPNAESHNTNLTPFLTFAQTVSSNLNDMVYASVLYTDGAATLAWTAPANKRNTEIGAGSNFQFSHGDQIGAASVNINGTISAASVATIAAFNIPIAGAVVTANASQLLTLGVG